VEGPNLGGESSTGAQCATNEERPSWGKNKNDPRQREGGEGKQGATGMVNRPNGMNTEKNLREGGPENGKRTGRVKSVRLAPGIGRGVGTKTTKSLQKNERETWGGLKRK